MPGVLIDDLDDPRVAIYRHLKATNQTRNAGQFVVEGEKLFDRLLASSFPLASVLTTDRLAARVEQRVPTGVSHYVLSEAKAGELVGFTFHQGVLACGVRRAWPSALSLARRARSRMTIAVCPRIDNPENLGAILRIADVFGVDAVLIGGRCPDPLSRRVLRVSMGSALRIPVIAPNCLADEVEKLRQELGFVAVATVIDPEAQSLDTFQRPDLLALFLGSEGHGLEPEWVEFCDKRVTIPMRPGAESLNVAVAAGIAFHSVMRDRDQIQIHESQPNLPTKGGLSPRND